MKFFTVTIHDHKARIWTFLVRADYDEILSYCQRLSLNDAIERYEITEPRNVADGVSAFSQLLIGEGVV